MSRRLSLFDSPFLLGFDQFERALDRVQRGAAEGYPPYNIEQIGETQLRITVAVAGFDMDDLSVQLEQNQLVIRGKRLGEEEDERVFLHRGIATRQFQRAFILSDDIEVKGASLDNGLLNIDLRRIVPETTVQTIAIQSAPKKGANGQGGRTIDVGDMKNDDKNGETR
jgi:HSP20 family molecular chaperone IbpA